MSKAAHCTANNLLISPTPQCDYKINYCEYEHGQLQCVKEYTAMYLVGRPSIVVLLLRDNACRLNVARSVRRHIASQRRHARISDCVPPSLRASTGLNRQQIRRCHRRCHSTGCSRINSSFPRSCLAYVRNLSLPAVKRTMSDRIFSRRQVEGLISDGKNVIICNGNVLSVNSWLKFHPGGDKAIMHMVGRDATDEINAYVTELEIGALRNQWETGGPF